MGIRLLQHCVVVIRKWQKLVLYIRVWHIKYEVNFLIQTLEYSKSESKKLPVDGTLARKEVDNLAKEGIVVEKVIDQVAIN